MANQTNDEHTKQGGTKKDVGALGETGGGESTHNQQGTSGGTSGAGKETQGHQGGSSTGSFRAKDSDRGATETAGANGAADGSARDKVKETGTGILEQAKTLSGDAYTAATDKASSLMDGKKTELSQSFVGAAETVRRMAGAVTEDGETSKIGEYATEYTEKAAQKLESAGRYFEKADLRMAARDLASFARREPALFLGGAFAVGLLVARLIKSTPPVEVAAHGAVAGQSHRTGNSAATATAAL